MKKLIFVIFAFFAISSVILSQLKQMPVAVYKAGKIWYVLDKSGNIIYQSNIILDVEGYSEGLLASYVFNGGEINSAYFNDAGEVELITPSQKPFLVSNNRVFVVKINDINKNDIRYGIVSTQAKSIKPMDYLDMFQYNEGLAYIMNHYERGYIDTNGEFKIKMQKGFVGYGFSEGLSPVSDANLNKFGYIDTTGKTIIPFKFDEARIFSEDMAVIFAINEYKRGAFGYINKSGNIIINNEYEEATNFKEGRAFVAFSDSIGSGFIWSLINQDGTRLTQFIFRAVLAYSEGLSAVQQMDYKWIYIDQNGKPINDNYYKYAGSYKDGMAFVISKDNEKQFIDKQGKVLFKIPNDAEVIMDCRTNEYYPHKYKDQ